VADSWQPLIDALDGLERAVRRVSAVNVNTATVRDGAKSLIQDYFRKTRPDLVVIGVDSTDLASVDQEMQKLLQLAKGRNPKRSYVRVLREIRSNLEHPD
jgi:predicted glycosyltransferase